MDKAYGNHILPNRIPQKINWKKRVQGAVRPCRQKGRAYAPGLGIRPESHANYAPKEGHQMQLYDSKINGHANGYVNGYVNGHANGSPESEAYTRVETNADNFRRILGCLMKCGIHGVWPEEAVCQEIDETHTVLDDDRRIFQAIRTLTAQGVYPTPAEVFHQIAEMEDGGGRIIPISQLMDIADGEPLPRKNDIHRLLDKSFKALKWRKLRHLAMRIIEGIGDIDPDAMADRAIEEIRSLAQHTRVSNAFSSLLELCGNVWQMEFTMNWLVEEFIQENALTMLSAESGDGKTKMCLSIASAVAQGKEFLGRKVAKRRVIYIDADMGLGAMKHMLYQLRIPESIYLEGQFLLMHQYREIDTEPPGPESPLLRQAIAESNNPLVIFDTLNCFLDGKDENNCKEIAERLRVFRRLIPLGATLLIPHHKSDKSEYMYRGASSMKDKLDAGWYQSRTDGTHSGDALGKLALRAFKARAVLLKRIDFEFRTFGDSDEYGAFELLRHSPAAPPAPPSDMEIVLGLVARYGDTGCSRAEIEPLAKAQGVSKNRLQVTLSEGVHLGEIIKKQGTGRREEYVLKSSPNSFRM